MTDPSHPEPSPAGTRRRLQALMNRGWSPEAIEAATGINADDIKATVGARSRPAPALDDRRVAAAYDRLWDRPPPAATARDRELIAQAQATAHQRGWPPPMAWDDDVIDAPAGEPARRWKPARTSYHRAADLAEDLAWIRKHGGYRDVPLAVAADRLGVKRDALEQATIRAARYTARQAEPEAEAG